MEIRILTVDGSTHTHPQPGAKLERVELRDGFVCVFYVLPIEDRVGYGQTVRVVRSQVFPASQVLQIDTLGCLHPRG